MHTVADMRNLAHYQLFLLPLDIVLFLAVVADHELMDVFDELLLHARLQCLKAI